MKFAGISTPDVQRSWVVSDYQELPILFFVPTNILVSAIHYPYETDATSPSGRPAFHVRNETPTAFFPNRVVARRHGPQTLRSKSPTPLRHVVGIQKQQHQQQERATRAGLPPSPPATGKGGKGNLILPDSDSHRFVLHIRDLTKQGNLTGVLNALGIAERRKEGVDVRGYNACIDGMAKAKRWGDALELLSRMRAAGIAPDSRSYVSAIEACCRSGQYDHASSLRREMAYVGVPQTPGCYRLDLEHLGNSGKWSAALNLLSDLRKANLTPDAKMYNCVLDAFARSSEWKTAAEVMREMERDGHELHARSYRGVIVAAANAGEWRAARRYFKRMLSRRVKKSSRSPVIFSSVTVACGAAGKWEEALEALRLTVRQGMVPTRIAYNATLGALGKAGQWQHAQRLLNEIRRSMRAQSLSGGSVSTGFGTGRPRPIAAPDVYSYTSVIDAFAKAGELERALWVLKDMRHARVRPSLVTLNALISACRAGGQWRRALAFVEEMRRSGIVPDDSTLTLILAACEAGGEWEEVSSRLKENPAERDAFIARLSIVAHARAGSWREGLEVLRGMRASGVPSDVGVYNALIESLVVRPLRRA